MRGQHTRPPPINSYMHITCPHCKKAYNIPEERVKKFGAHVVFPCPACRGKIEIDLAKNQQAPAASAVAHTGETLKKIILKTIQDLPPMPQVAQQARRVMADKNSSFSAIARVIETDQAISARVLKLANSAYYGVMGTVSSIQHASVVLGIKTLNQLLEIACTSKLLGARLDGYGMASGDLWRHSIAVAACARAIARRKYAEQADDAFTAGLLHDCGKIVLDRYIHEQKHVFQHFLQGGSKQFIEAERSILGFDHAYIASDICEKWNIPKKLALTIQHHHTPAQASFKELVCSVHAADAIVHMSGMTGGMGDTAPQIDEAAAKLLQLDRTLINVLIKETNDYVSKTISAL